MELNFTISKPESLTLWCYGLGFSLVLVALLAMKLDWQWLPVVRQQQLLIGGAIICLTGSLLNWLIPVWRKMRGKQ